MRTRVKTVDFRDFMRGEHDRRIRYYGDFYQVMAWRILAPFIAVIGLEMVLALCEMLAHMSTLM